MATGFTNNDGKAPTQGNAGLIPTDDATLPAVDSTEIFVSGRSDGAPLTDEQQRARQVRLAQERAQDEEDEQREREEKRKTEEKERQLLRASQRSHTVLGGFYHSALLNLHDEGEFLRTRPNGFGGNKSMISDRQLKAIILTAALEKNWTTMYFYRDRTHIDQTLTSRANAMIAELSKPGMPLEGVNIHASSQRQRWVTDPETQERTAFVEPWLNKTSLSRAWYGAVRPVQNNTADLAENFRTAVSGFFERLKTDRLFAAAPARNDHNMPG